MPLTRAQPRTRGPRRTCDAGWLPCSRTCPPGKGGVPRSWRLSQRYRWAICAALGSSHVPRCGPAMCRTVGELCTACTLSAHACTLLTHTGSDSRDEVGLVLGQGCLAERGGMSKVFLPAIAVSLLEYAGTWDLHAWSNLRLIKFNLDWFESDSNTLNVL